MVLAEAGPAWAADTPLYQPVSAWVKLVALPAAASLFGCGAALKAKGDAVRAKADFDAAAKIDPKVVEEFAGYGVAS